MKLSKNIFILLLYAAIIISMTACQGQNTTDSSKYPETIWKTAVSGEGIRDYIKEHQDELDQEALKLAAGDANISLNGQFKATVLLCELDYQKYMKETDGGNGDELFSAAYPVSASYAKDLLAKAVTDTEAFWEALEPAAYSYNYFINLFAAAGSVSGETLIQLTVGRPADYSEYEDSILEAVQQWLTEDKKHFTETAEVLAQAGFFKDKKFSELKSSLLSNDSIMLEDIDSSLHYIQVIRDTLIPVFEQDFAEGLKDLRKESELLGDICYMTGLTVTIPDTLRLTDEGLETETVELEGKKVIAFYHNKNRQEYPDSPNPLRILGDFMLTLPPEQFPENLEEADYWLILTPKYVLGDYYQTETGNSQQIREVYSFTSIDLYNAKNGRLLRHAGEIKEKPPASTYYIMGGDRSLLEYPSLVSADVIAYIYGNINEPERFRHMLDTYSEDQTSLGAGDFAGIGTWDLLLNTYEFVESFEDGNFLYTPKEGNEFLRCHFTIKNNNNKTMSLFPLIYHTGTDLYAELKDGENNIYQPLGGVYSAGYFSSTSFEPGESRSGYILFEVPLKSSDDAAAMNLEFSIKPQSVVYIIERN